MHFNWAFAWFPNKTLMSIFCTRENNKDVQGQARAVKMGFIYTEWSFSFELDSRVLG